MTLQRLLSLVRSCTDDYQMIRPDDRIAVGISGGKDSLALLRALAALKEFYPHPFTLRAVTVDMGFPGGTDFSPVRDFCESLGVEYTVVPTAIYRVIFEERKEKNPCSLCAKMRRGVIDRAAAELGCNKLALGHHADDVIDTFLLNLFYGGSLSSFSPVTYLEKSGITLIRPMIYVWEKELSGFIKKQSLPVVKSACPADKNTRREDVKRLLLTLEKDNRDIKAKIYGALRRAELSGFREFKKQEKP